MKELFMRAVGDRLAPDRATVSFLSGGLDSRCIVSALRELGVHVLSFNFFYLPESQDKVLASRIATALGTEHEAVQRPRRRLDTIQMMARTLVPKAADKPGIERPRLLWSGDGGSVGLGLVYIDRDIVSLMRKGNERQAIETLLSRHGCRLVRPIFTRSAERMLRDLPVEGAVAELHSLTAVEPGRRLHLFLITNDQRRHLADHFENIDLEGLDLHLPFFDADFLTAVLTAPLDQSIGHNLYHQWLDEFPAVTRSVPWQTYPGHVPCPLPIPAGMPSQWDGLTRTLMQRVAKPENLRSLWRTLRSRGFPHPILHRMYLSGYLALYLMGVRDYGWVARLAETFHRYWSRANGLHRVSPLDAP